MDKYYGIHDQWTDLDITNDVAIKSTDGVITSVKVNGEEYGGGSSDFSTAEVTINSSTSIRYTLLLSNYYDYDNGGIMTPSISSADIDTSIILNALLYKGRAMCILTLTGQDTPNVTVSGDIEDAGQKTYIITGDCTITVTDPD